uniref:Uncharacterized protein n=1 Tax=Oryza nivara TaxID=4536 RepID=A0A0E0I3A9_ORYNI
MLHSLYNRHRKGAHKRYHKLCWLWCYQAYSGRVPIRDITNYAGFGATQAYSGTVILKGLLWVLEVLIHCFDQ